MKELKESEEKEMTKKYELIKQDTTNKLTVGKIYTIKDFGNHKSIVNKYDETIQIYVVTDWQIKNMFREVK